MQTKPKVKSQMDQWLLWDALYGGRQLPFKSDISHPAISNPNISNFKISNLNISNFKISNLNMVAALIIVSLLSTVQALVSDPHPP